MVRKCVGLGLCLLVIFVSEGNGLKLPSYIKACSRHDPNLNQCALKNGRLAIPQFIQGDRKYKVPPLNPFSIPQLRVLGGQRIKLDLKDIKIYGLQKVHLKKVDIDMKKHKIFVEFSVPQATILNKYNISGKILVLPITGRGNGNVTMDNLNVKYSLNYDIVKKGSKGELYIKPKTGDIKYDISRAYIKLDNLFNGDKLLGKQMHIFLNENWKEVAQELGPPIADAIGKVIFQIISSICELVPYDHILPEKL